MKTRTMNVLYWILTILFALAMLFSAISELMHTPSADKALTDLGYPVYLNTILGIAKLLGVIAIVQTKWNTIKEWAYAGFTIDIVGAALSIYLNGDGIAMALMTLPFLVVLFVSYSLWKKLSNR